MQVKTFTGKSTQEVLALIKDEMGSNAVILGNRSYRKDNVRFYEITAGLEQQPYMMGGESVGMLQGGGSGWSEWHKEWLQIKEHLFSLMKPAIQMERLTPRQRVALEYLQREGVSDLVVLELYKRLLAKPGASVLESLGELVSVKGWSAENWPQRVQMVAGPFGAGKTTCAIRMALQLRSQNPDMSIAFINADCVRGNGRLILRHWSELSDFAYFEAANASAMSRSFEASLEFDRVFIDMPGVTGQNTLVANINELGLGGLGLATHLVLPPHYGSAQFSAFLARYKTETLPGGVVWTKLDEAASYGALINVAVAGGLPISAFSHGASLKDTLTAASEPALWRLIFKRQLPGEVANPGLQQSKV